MPIYDIRFWLQTSRKTNIGYHVGMQHFSSVYAHCHVPAEGGFQGICYNIKQGMDVPLVESVFLVCIPQSILKSDQNGSTSF